MRFMRWRRLTERQTAGERIEAADAQWLVGYETTAEFRSMKSFYDDPVFGESNTLRPAG